MLNRLDLPMTREHDTHGELEAIHSAGFDCDADRDIDSRLSGADLGDLLDDSDASDHWQSDTALPVDVLGREDPLALSLDRLSQLRHAAQGHVSVARRRGPLQALSKGQKFDEEDFEAGVEREAFQIVRGFAQRLFQPLNVQDIESAIRWFFTIGAPEHITFDLCCRVLEVRPEVFRLRCHYEFFLRDVMFARPLPFETVPVPTVISRELAYFPGEVGRCLAGCAWRQPGIEHAQLHASAQEVFGRDDEKFASESIRHWTTWSQSTT
ncbi:MAG: hypothetical protein HC794_09045 [Nitrospiraceae bacterium]|nr:hypothetical protein [Nitrospiraceae bacterium]